MPIGKRCSTEQSNLGWPGDLCRMAVAWVFIDGWSKEPCRGCISFVGFAFALSAALTFTKPSYL
jgi:hypothetical protein